MAWHVCQCLSASYPSLDTMLLLRHRLIPSGPLQPAHPGRCLFQRSWKRWSLHKGCDPEQQNIRNRPRHTAACSPGALPGPAVVEGEVLAQVVVGAHAAVVVRRLRHQAARPCTQMTYMCPGTLECNRSVPWNTFVHHKCATCSTIEIFSFPNIVLQHARTPPNIAGVWQHCLPSTPGDPQRAC